jgi:hypothetical protein
MMPHYNQYSSVEERTKQLALDHAEWTADVMIGEHHFVRKEFYTVLIAMLLSNRLYEATIYVDKLYQSGRFIKKFN